MESFFFRESYAASSPPSVWIMRPATQIDVLVESSKNRQSKRWFYWPGRTYFYLTRLAVRRPPSTLKLDVEWRPNCYHHVVEVAVLLFMHQRDTTNTLAQHVGWKKINAVDGGHRWLLPVVSMLCISDQRSSVADDHIIIIETAEYEIILSTENDSNTED